MTKKEWNALSDKAKWDIKVAMRGPDSYFGETLKWFTTSVLRGHVSKVFRVGGTVNSDLQLVILPSSSPGKVLVRPNINVWSWNAGHFIQHIRDAAGWMNIPVLNIPESVWFTVMKYESSTQAAKEILNYLHEHVTYPVELVKEVEHHYQSGTLPD